MKREVCAVEIHEEMKRSPVLFLRCTFIGFQRLPGMPTLMLRNCECGATISNRLSTIAAMYPMAVEGVTALMAIGDLRAVMKERQAA